ncbi:MAG TPA: amidohydrolase family protein [Pseudonocardia sp.]
MGAHARPPVLIRHTQAVDPSLIDDVVLTGARVLDPAAPAGPAELRVAAGRVVSVREAAGPGPLDGLVITPAFVDAHVHATATGLLVDGLDLAGCPSPEALLDAVAVRAAARPGALIWGHGWQELGWSAVPGRAALDRAAAGSPVYLSRVDVHSALVSSVLVARAPAAVGAAGWSHGPLTADAHHHVRRAALAAVDPATRRAAQDAFLRGAAAAGIGVVHECAGPDISSVEDLRALVEQAGADPTAPRVVPYWGAAVTTADEARQLLATTGAHGLAGDLFVDGSLGSHTAALRSPYADAPGSRGHPYLEAEQIGAHVAACTLAGVQAGFHVIGDAAADALVQGLALAAAQTSPGAVRARAHRVEHLEMVDTRQQAVLADLGVVASVQPLFDAWWGGSDRMYVQRLGPERARGMNPFAALRTAGVTLALGSDSPVTPLGPWAAVRAAVDHHTAGSGVPLDVALAAHTTGGHRCAGDFAPLAGRLVAGAPASYAVWDMSGDPRCLQTVQDGRILYSDL